MKLLNQFLEQKVTSYHEKFDNWQDALTACGQPLVQQGFITEVYIDAIIECVNKYGPYIVIAPDIAMPHSTENAEGVIKTGIGFMKVETPVVFDADDREKDARLFFTLVSSNHDEHLNNMVELSNMLTDDDLVLGLLNVKNDEDLAQLAQKYNKGE